MKRLLFAALFITIASIFSQSVKANCVSPANLGGSCVGGLISCNGGTLCCSQLSECNNSGADPLCDGGVGVNTAIGCLDAGQPERLVFELLNWGVGVGIGIAFLMIIFAGFQITTAAGDPKRVKAGQELLTSAITGLILIIFSVVLLNFIGVKLLNLPGFVGNTTI